MQHSDRGTPRRVLPLLTAAGLVAASVVALSATTTATANPVVKAFSTTTNPGASTGNGDCLHAQPQPTNCNQYASKEDVWASGLPDSADLADGTYFLAVLAPGGQPDPNDGGAKNLSDGYDSYLDRSFSMTGGTIGATPDTTHLIELGRIQAFEYADTPNPGGVYIMAICSLADGYPVRASDCKYDAFKVRAAEPPTMASPLTILKDAAGAYDLTYTWTIDKRVDRTVVQTTATTATFDYEAQVTPDAGTVSDVAVSGTITVFNPNDGTVSDVGVSDSLSDGTTCTVEAVPNPLPSGETDLDYTCDLGDSLPAGALANTAEVSWPAQTVDPDGALAAGSDDFTFSDIAFAAGLVDDCVDVSDLFEGEATPVPLGTICVDDADKTVEYSKTVAVPRNVCVSYDNTATFVADDSGASDSDGQTVTVCGPITGGHTMGFWQNKNGQALIKGDSSTAGVCGTTTYLRQFAPFQDLKATATCNEAASYVTNVIKKANASGATMNAMLKGQMLATALSVHLFDPALGGRTVDVSDWSAAFGGADAMTVDQMLAYAASQSNVGGTSWYGQSKSVQELAKNAFDGINNQVVFAAP